MKLWDPRQRQSVGEQSRVCVCVCVCVCVSSMFDTDFTPGTYDQSGESVYTMSLCGDRLVVGTSNRKVRIMT